MPVVEPFDDPGRPFETGPEHRATLADGKTVAIGPDDIDVGGTGRDLLLEDLRPLIDQGVERALDDLVRTDRTRHDATLGGLFTDQRLDLWIWNACPGAGLVKVE